MDVEGWMSQWEVLWICLEDPSYSQKFYLFVHKKDVNCTSLCYNIGNLIRL